LSHDVKPFVTFVISLVMLLAIDLVLKQIIHPICPPNICSNT
jgi:hypothetical protein